MRRSNDNDYTQIHGTVLRMSQRAVLVRLTEGRREAWIPQSVIFEDDLAGLDVGVVGEINVQEWFHDKELA